VIRALALLVAGVVAGGAGPGPLGATLPGTVKSLSVVAPKTGLPANLCAINATLNAAATGVTLLGPATALYRRDVADGPVTLTLPPVIYGSLTGSSSAPVATVLFGGVGAVRLTFKSAKSGTIAFLPGGVTMPDAAINPLFSSYTAIWNGTLNRMFVSFDLRMGKCAVPLVGVFQS